MNPEECVGEIVNTEGMGPFEGYYRNDEAMARTTRNGWYWSGDLGYVDADDWVYFAGRTSDWLRVDGENFPATPIEAIVARHPDVMMASVYGVPDVDAGDQVMAAVVLPAADFDPDAFAAWINAQSDLSPKWRPRYMRVCETLPTTPTNKVLVRRSCTRSSTPTAWAATSSTSAAGARPPTGCSSRPQEARLRSAFEESGRIRAWDL